jgi:hypothetical protein
MIVRRLVLIVVLALVTVSIPFNLKTAKTLGLTIPTPVLVRADQVIK